MRFALVLFLVIQLSVAIHTIDLKKDSHNFDSTKLSVGDAPATLDLSQYTRGPGQDFTTTSSFNTSVWTNVFNTNGGNNFWFSKTESIGLLISSNQAAKWPQSGFMQLFSSSCQSGFGYGVFHYTASIPVSNSKQGFGINLILWNSDGTWLDAKNGDTISEVDILEANNNQGFSTLHYYNGNGSNHNGQIFHTIKDPSTGEVLDLTKWNHYDLMWADSLMALYINNKLLYSITSEQVPKDHVHGGCDKTFGAQVVIQVGNEPLPTVQLMLQNMWHYTPNA